MATIRWRSICVWAGLLCGKAGSAIAGAALVLGAATAAAASFDAWLDEMRREASARGVAAATFERAMAGVRPLPRVIELDRRQPEFTQTFWTYLDRRVTPERIARGRQLLALHRSLLDDVQRRYGVAPRFLVALWGLESNYGSYTGEYPLFAALATLAYDPRRAAFFREQLLAALAGAERGDIPFAARASWAGAMGQPQFMPTTYEAYAVDFDGDGRIDLWNSLPDVFASAANFLAAVGWRDDHGWGREVDLPAAFDYAASGLEIWQPLAEWQRRGVRPAGGRDLPATDMMGAIVLPGGASGGPAILAYPNIKAIMRWNRSILYAVAVGHLADRLVGGEALAAPRPASEVALSRAEVMELQRLLGRLGFDTGSIDGIVGSQTRRAIRGFQQQAMLPADGYPSVDLLQQLRSAAYR